MDWLYVILWMEALIIGLFLLLVLIGVVWEYIDKKLNPIYPHCDIDPRYHKSFVWKDGNGWIGNIPIPDNTL